jgi:hypothetical protein
LQDDRRRARQTAYQVLVASSLSQLNADQGDLWDSGRVESDATAHIVYSVLALRVFSWAAWKVRVWDGDGATSRWSEAARFELGPLTSDDWRLDRGERGEDGWRGATFISAAVVGDPKTSAPAGRTGGEPRSAVALSPGMAPAASVAAFGSGRNDHRTAGIKPVVMDASGLAPGTGVLELDGALAASIGRVLAARMEVAPPRPRSGHGHGAGNDWQDGGVGAGVVWVRCE